MSGGGGKDAKVGSQATALKKTRTLFQNLQRWPSSLDTTWSRWSLLDSPNTEFPTNSWTHRGHGMGPTPGLPDPDTSPLRDVGPYLGKDQ